MNGQATSPTIDEGVFREALGNFCSGITIIIAMDGDRPVGFACQSFASLSVDPALVLFCVMKTSCSWRRIEAADSFAVTVLADSQRETCAVFGRGGPDKFADVSWSRSPSGAPIIDCWLAWLDCRVDDVHDGGDPLLYHRGRYATTDSAC